MSGVSGTHRAITFGLVDQRLEINVASLKIWCSGICNVRREHLVALSAHCKSVRMQVQIFTDPLHRSILFALLFSMKTVFKSTFLVVFRDLTVLFN